MNKKKISIICAAVLTLCAVVGGVVLYSARTQASGTQMTIAAESPTVVKDDEVTVVVTATSGEAMSYIQADLTYDPEMLEFVGSSTDMATGGSGVLQIMEILEYGETERSYELTFKALKVGTADINMNEIYIKLYESLDLVSPESDSTSVEVIVNTSISEDARIQAMMIAGAQDFEFNPDVYTYDMEVGLGMDMFISSVIPMQEDSIVTAPEDLTLEVGENCFEITVTAPAGNSQTYVFNITRLDYEPEPEIDEISAETTEDTPDTVAEGDFEE